MTIPRKNEKIPRHAGSFRHIFWQGVVSFMMHRDERECTHVMPLFQLFPSGTRRYVSPIDVQKCRRRWRE